MAVGKWAAAPFPAPGCAEFIAFFLPCRHIWEAHSGVEVTRSLHTSRYTSPSAASSVAIGFDRNLLALDWSPTEHTVVVAAFGK